VALALDFDGVICNSLREVLVVALEAYERIADDPRLVQEVRTRRGGRSWFDYPIEDDPVFAPFVELLPLGNRAEDFGIACLAIESGRVPSTQHEYDALFDTVEEGWRRLYHDLFYDQRERLRDADLEGWMALHRDYPPITELLQRRSGDVELAIATAKDGRSVRLVLDRFGLGSLFPPDRLLDKDLGRSKAVHLQELAGRLAVDPDSITFVDDKVNHLVSVAPLGVRPVLAEWGYNGDRERRIAADHGFSIATLDTVEAILFDGAGT
jgi:phosphoglycolate phosphatase-like HAD superfamily hydrolase